MVVQFGGESVINRWHCICGYNWFFLEINYCLYTIGVLLSLGIELGRWIYGCGGVGGVGCREAEGARRGAVGGELD